MGRTVAVRLRAELHLETGTDGLLVNVLAIETSSPAGAVALLADGRLLAEETLGDGSRHGRDLVSCIDRLLIGDASLVDLIAVSIGPGSYTGLRVGVTFAKTFAVETGKPVVGVSSLDVVAENVVEGSPLCVAVDARLGQVYAALYDGGRRKVLGDTVAAPADVAGRLEPGTWVVGDALGRYRDVFGAVRGVRIVDDEARWRPRAVSVGVLGRVQFNEAGGADPRELVPRYLRRPQAEVKWGKPSGVSGPR